MYACLGVAGALESSGVRGWVAWMWDSQPDGGSGMARRVKVLVKDLDSSVRKLYRHALSADTRLQVVAYVGSCREALYHALEWDLDVFITNIKSFDGCAFDTVRKIMAACPRVRVLYVSGFAGPPFYARALSTRPAGYMVKPFRVEKLVDVVRRVAAGENYYSRCVQCWRDELPDDSESFWG